MVAPIYTHHVTDRGWLRQDIPAIVEMMINCGEEDDPSCNWRQNRVKYLSWLRRNFNSAHHYFHVITIDTRIVAIVGLCPSRLKGIDGCLHSLYVEPQYRSHGWGRLLINRLFDYAREVHMTHLEAAIPTSSVACELFQAVGFALVLD